MIVISQILFWFDVKATFEVVKPPAVPTEQDYSAARSSRPTSAPTEPEPPTDYQVVTETAKVKGLLTGEGVRYLFTSFVDNFRQLLGRHDHPGRDDRRRPGGGGRADRPR